MSLSGWDDAKSLSMVIKPAIISQDIVDFVLCIRIGISTQDGYDSSYVFDELGYSESKKIAITYGDGNTENECLVEVASCNKALKYAVLWVKVPLISSTKTTCIKLYYDRSHSDNPNIYYTADAGTHTVWDIDYKGVWHFEYTPIIDSTGINDTAVIYGSVLPKLSKVGKALRFVANGDRIDFGASTEINLTSMFTVELFINLSAGISIFKKGTQYYIQDTTNLMSGFINSDSVVQNVYSGKDISAAGWVYLVWLFDASSGGINTELMFLNSTTVGLLNPPIQPSSQHLYIGDSANSIRGDVCELRISDSMRDANWLKAQEDNFNDALLTVMQYEVSGVVTVLGIPKSLKVCLYNRNSGKLVSTSISDQNGVYYLAALTTEEHNVIGFEDNHYNHVIVSKVIPHLKK